MIVHVPAPVIVSAPGGDRAEDGVCELNVTGRFEFGAVGLVVCAASVAAGGRCCCR